MSPVTRFTFDDDWRPLTKPSSLKKPSLGGKKESPSKYKKQVRFGQVSQKVMAQLWRRFVFCYSMFTFQIFYPVAHLYHLDSWPSSLRYDYIYDVLRIRTFPSQAPVPCPPTILVPHVPVHGSWRLYGLSSWLQVFKLSQIRLDTELSILELQLCSCGLCPSL